MGVDGGDNDTTGDEPGEISDTFGSGGGGYGWGVCKELGLLLATTIVTSEVIMNMTELAIT